MKSIDIINYFANRSKDNSSKNLRSSALSYTTVTRWAKRFHEGGENVSDHPRSASTLSQFTGENIQLVRQTISNDPPSIYDEIIAETSLSWYNRTDYPRLPQDEKSCISLSISSTNS